MGQAEAMLGKPVLLEEFGKRLIKGTDSQLFQDAIDHLRNPVFDTTYTLVTAAIQSCALISIYILLPATHPAWATTAHFAPTPGISIACKSEPYKSMTVTAGHPSRTSVCRDHHLVFLSRNVRFWSVDITRRENLHDHTGAILCCIQESDRDQTISCVPLQGSAAAGSVVLALGPAGLRWHGPRRLWSAGGAIPVISMSCICQKRRYLYVVSSPQRMVPQTCPQSPQVLPCSVAVQ